MLTNRISWTFTGKTRRHHIVFEHNTLSGSRKIYVNGIQFQQTGWRFDLTGVITFTLEIGTIIEIMIKADDVGLLYYYLSVNGKEIVSDQVLAKQTTTISSPKAVSLPTSPNNTSSSSTSSSLFSSFFFSPLQSPLNATNNNNNNLRLHTNDTIGDYVWNVPLPDGLYQIEFFSSNFDILINNIRIDNIEGTFADDGPGTVYKIPITKDIYGTITAIPLSLSERKLQGKEVDAILSVDTLGIIPPSEYLIQ